MPHKLQLPNFSVVVWVIKTQQFETLRRELLAIAGHEPDESTEYQGMVDFHWGFESQTKAQDLAKALQTISQKPEIVVLRLSGLKDPAASITLKDERNKALMGDY